MDVIWMDGAEHYSNVPNDDITTVMKDGFFAQAESIFLGAAPRTGNYNFIAALTTANMRRSAQGDRVRSSMAFGFKMDALPIRFNGQNVLCEFRDELNAAVVSVQIGTTGRVIVSAVDYSTGTSSIIQSSTLEVAAGVWNHFEVKVFADASDGYAKVRVNGRDFVSVTGGISLPNDLPVAQVFFGGGSGSANPMFNGSNYYDDMVFMTYDDTEDSTWLGLYGVYYLRPNGDDSTYQDFALSSGSTAYALINELKPDGDTSFIYSSNAGDKSSFTVEALPANVETIFAIAPVVFTRKTDSGVGSIAVGVISFSTENEGDDKPVLTNYSYFAPTVYGTDPGNSDAPWTPDHLPKIIIERTE